MTSSIVKTSYEYDTMSVSGEEVVVAQSGLNLK